MTSFVVFSKICRHCRLKPFSDTFDCPSGLSDKVVFINDNGGIGKESLCQVCVRTPHITDKELYPVPFGFRDVSEIGGQERL